MSATSMTSITEKPAATPALKSRRPKQPGGATLGQDQSREARRLAAAILEVLAGARTPAEAATVLNVSVPRYYQIEGRALQGLVQACEAKPKGRAPSLERELAALRRDNERLQRDVGRQQALVRMAQRTMGLPPPSPSVAGKSGTVKSGAASSGSASSGSASSGAASSGKKIRKRRVARALGVAARLQQPAQPESQPEDPAAKSQGASSSPGDRDAAESL